MTEWSTTEPPLGVRLEYERDNGSYEVGVLEHAGSFGIGKSGKTPRLRQQFRRQGTQGLEMFEVKRWRRSEIA